MKKTILILPLLLAFAACSSDDDNNKENEIEYTYEDIPYTSGHITYGSSTTSWRFENAADWAYFSPTSGGKNETSEYRYQENPTNAIRYDTLTFIQSGNRNQYDIIRQAANPNK